MTVFFPIAAYSEMANHMRKKHVGQDLILSIGNELYCRSVPCKLNGFVCLTGCWRGWNETRLAFGQPYYESPWNLWEKTFHKNKHCQFWLVGENDLRCQGILGRNWNQNLQDSFLKFQLVKQKYFSDVINMLQMLSSLRTFHFVSSLFCFISAKFACSCRLAARVGCTREDFRCCQDVGPQLSHPRHR